MNIQADFGRTTKDTCIRQSHSSTAQKKLRERGCTTDQDTEDGDGVGRRERGVDLASSPACPGLQASVGGGWGCYGVVYKHPRPFDPTSPGCHFLPF